MVCMSVSALEEWQFSSEQGERNYNQALREYPAQVIVDLAALRDNMRHLVDITNREGGPTEVMGRCVWARSGPLRFGCARRRRHVARRGAGPRGARIAQCRHWR